MKHQTKIAAALLALVASLALAACGGDDETTTTEAASTAETAGKEARSGYGKKKEVPGTTIVVRNGEPVGGVRELEYSAGDAVEFSVRSDVADEIHVHGYDLMEDVPAGGSVSFSFPAEIEGIFEVELEQRGTEIAELRVNP
jgi:hypothetical protein